MINMVETFTAIENLTVPVGGVIAWHKDWNDLSSNIVENFQACDGSEITDNESPLVGEFTPNLNGDTDETKKFIKGSTTSGTVGGTTTHTHTRSLRKYDKESVWRGNTPMGPKAASHIPKYFDVKFMIRIK